MAYCAEVETTQKTVEEAQEGLGAIPLAERHSEKFKRAERGSDCSFWDVFRCYRYLVVCTHKVSSRKDCHSMKRRDTFGDMWKWIAMGDGDEIYSTVVATWWQVPFFRFFDHVKGRCLFAIGWAANAKLHHARIRTEQFYFS